LYMEASYKRESGEIVAYGITSNSPPGRRMPPRKTAQGQCLPKSTFSQAGPSSGLLTAADGGSA
jgi:hypothetical protein